MPTRPYVQSTNPYELPAEELSAWELTKRRIAKEVRQNGLAPTTLDDGQVEVVLKKLTPKQYRAQLTARAIMLAIRVLVVWWAAASFFPELGLTYWQIILPVFALRALILPNGKFEKVIK